MNKKKAILNDNSGRCVICEKEADLEYYLTKATSEEVAVILMHISLCVKHARMIDDANMKREIERTVA